MAIFSADELEAFRSGNRLGSVDWSARQAPKQQTRGRGGFLSSLISEGGAAGGAALGTALLPGIGTIIGGGLGALGGRLVENKVRDDRFDGDSLREAVTEGGLTAALSGAGKLFKAAKGAKAAKAGAAAGDEVLKTSARGKVDSFINKGLSQQYGTLSKPVRNVTRPAQTVAELADAGIFKPQEAERIGRAITGSDGILNKAVIRATGGAGRVDTSTLRQVFTDALDNNAIEEGPRKALQKFFDAQMVRLSGGAKGSLSAKADPSDALSFMKSLEQRIINLSGKGANYARPTPERLDQASVLRLVKDELEERLFAGAGANKNLKNILTPQLRQELVKLSPKNKQWASWVDNNVMKATDVGALRSAQRPFVAAQQMIDEGADNAFSAGGQIAGSLRGKAVDLASRVGVGGAARTAAKASRMQMPGSGLVGALTATPTRAAASGAFVASGLEGALNPPTVSAPEQPALEGEVMGLGAGSAPGIDAGMSNFGQAATSSSPFAPENVEANVQAILEQGGDFKDISEYLGLVEALQGLRGGGGAMNSTTQKAMGQAANADAALSQLEQFFSAAGGGSGPVMGRLQNALGKAGVDKDNATYNALADSAVAQIARALGETGAITDADIRVYRRALPNITDPPEVAQAKLNALRQRMQVAQQNAMMFGGGASIADQSGSIY